MKQWIVVAACAAGIVGPGQTAALAQIIYASVSRSVSATTNDGSSTYSNNSPGTWQQDASFSDPMGNASASASQTSHLMLDRIEFVIHAGAGNLNGYLAESRSRLDTTFSVAITTPYELTFTDIGGLTEVFGLTRAGADVLPAGVFPHTGLIVTGVLEPGTYRLYASASGLGASSGPDLSGEVAAILSVPAPSTALGISVAFGLATLRRRR